MSRRVMRSAVWMMVALALALPAFAGGANSSKIRFGLNYVSPTGTLEESEGSEFLELSADAAAGFFVAYEYQFSDLLGIEPSLSFQSHDVKVKGNILDVPIPEVTIADVDVMPLLVALNFHVLDPESTVDLYLAPIVGYVTYGDLNIVGESSEALDDAFAVGAGVGVDIPFGESNWAFTAAAQYLTFSADPSVGGDGLDIDPFVLRAGAAVQF